jgi:hypothetical protein
MSGWNSVQVQDLYALGNLEKGCGKRGGADGGHGVSTEHEL